MSAAPGSQFLLQLQNADQSYAAVAGLQTRSLQIEARPAAKLDVAADGWRHLQPGGAVQAMRIAGDGIFTAAAAAHLLGSLHGPAHAEARITLPGFGRFSGPFAVTELAFEGEEDELIVWRLALQSAGEVRFEVA